MRDAVLIVGTILVAIGLLLILWRELGGAVERRRTGAVRDTFEVLLPIVATVALVAWVWVG
jgi:hypothetical protein